MNQQVIARPESRPQSSPGAGAWAALLVVWVVWGSTYVAIRVGDRSIPPLAMAAVRYLAAGALLYPVARLRGGRLRSDRLNDDRLNDDRLHDDRPYGGRARPSGAQWAGMAVVGTLLLAFGNGGLSYAEQTLPAGLAALLVASVPLWMALANLVINGRRLRPTGWAALITGLAGIAVLAQPHGRSSLLPVLIVLGASLSWGVGSVLAGRLPVPVVSTYAYVNPIVAVGLGALLLGERPTWSALLGGAIVVASVALLLTNRKGEGQ